ncbi:MAG: hypothetical protein J7465_11700 [Chloroflexus sp.]|jgi:hypothetical protein|nr:hypothetical protein [Chloroflexus sp.]MBO9374636.1 hypothetical protein [Chloroflexus sp.]
MNQTRKPMRADVSGLKWAISTAALAATIGGWGWLTAQNPPEVAIAAPQIAVQPPAVERQPLPPWLTDDPMLPVLPTVVPLNIPARDQVAAPPPAPAAPPPASAAPPPAPAAPPPAPAAPALREVTIPAPAPAPAPAARTRSSR